MQTTMSIDTSQGSPVAHNGSMLVHGRSRHALRILFVTAKLALATGLFLVGTSQVYAQTCPTIYQINDDDACTVLTGVWNTFQDAAEAGWQNCHANGAYTNPVFYLGTCSPSGTATASARTADCFIYEVGVSGPVSNLPAFSQPVTPTPCGIPVKNLGCQSCNAKGGPMHGNPINSSTGNKYQEETDYAGVGPFPLILHRHYNSYGDGTGTIGNRWGHTFERSVIYQNSSSVQLIRDDGQYLFFSSCSGGWCPDADETGILTEQTGSGGVITGWQFVDTNDVVELYNAAGALISETSRGGIVHTLSYDGLGRLSSVVDSFGKSFGFVYDSSNRVHQVSEPGGALITYAYDTSGNLSTVTYPDTTVRTYFYDETAYVAAGANPYMLTGIQDESAQRYATYSYDSQSRALSSQHYGGADLLEFTYNSGGTTTIVDALGTSRTYTYQTILNVNHIGAVSGPECSSCGLSASYSYDPNGDLSATTDFNGNQTLYDIDSRHLEESRTEANGASTARTITTMWSPSFRIPQTSSVYAGSTATGTPLRTTSYYYDGSGNALTVTVTDPTVTPNVSRTWHYTYDSFGNVLTAQSPRTDLNSTTTFTPYVCTTGFKCGQLHRVVDPLGNVTTYNSYNAHGQPLTITDPNGTVTTLTYDLRQRLTSREVGSETTSFAYYPTGLLHTVTLPDASALTYIYDKAHRLTQITDSAGNYVIYGLDAMGNRTSEKTYDPSNALHRTHTRYYNALSELYQDVNAANTAAVTTTFGYDNNGNQNSIAAPLGRNTADYYDQLNRLNQITDPNGGNTYFSYDANDNLTSVQDPRSLTTGYEYNGFGDVTQLVSPDSGTSAYTYDSGGDLSTSTDGRTAIATYTYDALNRVKTAAYAKGGTTDQTITYTYDTGPYGIGHLTGASDANHTLSWGYDFAGRVIGKSQTVGTVTKSVSYGYTNADLTTLTTPSGQNVVYGYNGNHQIVSISINGSTLLSNATYEPLGPVNGWTWGDGSADTRLYNGDGLVSQINAIETTSYVYDYANRIYTITNTSNSMLSWTYGYDLLDRINSAVQSGSNFGWTYDANGNRLTQTGTDPWTLHIRATNNQVLNTTGTQARTYTYDKGGNTLTYSGNTFTYSDSDRMKTLAVGGSTTTYVVNALGQRVQKSGGPAGTVLYMYDEAGHLLGEYGSGGTLIEETVWLGDTPVATLLPSGSSVAIYYVHSDHLNAPRKISVPFTAQQLAWRWDNDPFGTFAPNQSPNGLATFVYNPRFPGQMYDSETGLNYNYQRDFDSQTGRYVESDPAGLKGGINTYSYARLNPLTWIDPSGLDSCPGGEWSQDLGDSGFYGAFGGYFSKGRVTYTCRSNPSLKCSAGIVCIGGGAIVGGGISWNLYGYVVGAPNSSELAGWSGWQVATNIGLIGLQAPPGGGVGVSAGIGGGAGLAAIKCYTYAMICTSGCGH